MVEKIIFKVLKISLEALSPSIKSALEGFYQSLKAKAAETENEWDDLLVGILGILLGFE